MFLDYLLSQNIITEVQYNRILSELDTEHQGNLTTAIMSVGVSEDSITQAKSSFYKIPYKKLKPQDISYQTIKHIPEDAARHYRFIPISFEEGVLSIGVTEPENIESMNALQFISAKLGIPFKVFLISYTDFLAVAENYKVSSEEVDAALGEFSNELEMANKELAKEEQSYLERSKSKKNEDILVEDAPIIKIVAVLINQAVEAVASDIHIENTGAAVRVRYRVDGLLTTTLTLPINSFAGIVARIKILSRLRLDEKRKPQDGSFATVIDGRKIEFRVSTFPAYHGEKVVLRILDSERGVKKLEDLDLTDKNLAMVKKAIEKSHGMILVSGPTGSGKSTTLYAMLGNVDSEGSNVTSLEDPVEYQIPNITQSQVMPEIGYTFATGLRSVLRQDPDIIMVGEIRDKETAQLAIQAALTGHLVFSTIHTNSAIGIVPRLIDMGVDPYLIAPTLVLAIAQRLVRRMHPSAKHEVPMDSVTREFITKEFSDLDPKYLQELQIPETMYDMRPTSEAPNGTKGRMAVFEMFEVDKKMQEIILKSPTEPELYKAVRERGMLTMKEDALLKALNGDVPIQEVYGF